MGERRKTFCDLCGMTRPENYTQAKGWVYVLINGEDGHKDFCPPCWSPVQRIMSRSFIDGLMMEALGFEDIDE